jgi:hypothetical protein
MTTSNDLNVVGHALYLELVRSDSTAGYCQQVIITPEGKTTDGRVVPMTMYRRRLSTNAPRKTWKQFGSSRTAAFAIETSGSIPDPAGRLDNTLNQMTSFMEAALKSIASNNYKVQIKPIIVEVVASDMDEIKNGKTPYKLLGRFMKVRKVLGFPKDLIPERMHPAHTVL